MAGILGRGKMAQNIETKDLSVPTWQIEQQPYGETGCRRAIAANNAMKRYADLCAQHGVTDHFTSSARCAQCVALDPDITRAEARKVGRSTYAAECPTHGRTDHSVAHGRCLTCFNTAGARRVAESTTGSTPRAAARRSGQPTFVETCLTHGSTEHSVAHGKCLSCFTTAGVRRVGPTAPRETYRSPSYRPELVTGVYVRRQREGLYVVNEAATGTGRWANMAGHGGTLRTYETNGAEIPDDVRQRADTERTTILWEYRV